MTTLLATEEEQTAPRHVATQRALARELGFSPTMINRWVNEPGFPVSQAADGGTLFDVEECRQWLSRRRNRRPGPRIEAPENASEGELEDATSLEARHYQAKVEKEEADARLKAMKADALEGRYVDRAVYEKDLIGIAALFRRVLTEQPERVRAEHGDEAHDIMLETVDVVWALIEEAGSEILGELEDVGGEEE